MAGNFWAGTHCDQWIFDKHDLQQMRHEDLKIFSEEEYQKLMIFWSNFIQALGTDGNTAMQQQGTSASKTRMQVIATAIMYFRRFYARTPFKNVDPFLMACTALLLASKVEEHGVMSMSKLYLSIAAVPIRLRVKNQVQGRSKRFDGFIEIIVDLVKQHWPFIEYDPNSRLITNGNNTNNIYEAEWILLEILDCCMVVYHPYKPLTTMIQDIKKDPTLKDLDKLADHALCVVNDSLRTDACLLFPPHIIALSALIIAAEMLSREKDIKNWVQEIAADFDKVFECCQMILSMYKLWKGFDDKKQLKPLIDKLPRIVGGTE